MMEATYHSEQGEQFFLTTRTALKPNDPTAGPFLSFTKGHFNETLIVSSPPQAPDEDEELLQLEVESPFEDYVELLSSLLISCKLLSKEKPEGEQTLLPIEDLTSEMLLCLSSGLFHDLDKLLLQRQDLLAMRDAMTSSLRNYTCDDDSLETTRALTVEEEMIHEGVFEVRTLLKQEAAQIFVIPKFVTEKECQHLVETSRPHLERAAVVGPDGNAEYSESRRAQQTGYDIAGGVNDPLWYLTLSFHSLSPLSLSIDLSEGICMLGF
jgi:hypothetical protein